MASTTSKESVPFRLARLYGEPLEPHMTVGAASVYDYNTKEGIPAGIRYDGLVTYDADAQKSYQLIGGTDDSDWQTYGSQSLDEVLGNGATTSKAVTLGSTVMASATVQDLTDAIVYADSNSILRELTIGSGLAYAGGTLSANPDNYVDGVTFSGGTITVTRTQAANIPVVIDGRYILISDRGVADGVVPLNSSGKIDSTYLPDSIVGQVEYQGQWNASTNTPAIPAASSANKGHYYIVTGSAAIGHGYANVPNIAFNPKDWIISDGVAWDIVDNTDSISTVFGRAGNVVAADADYSASQVVFSPYSTLTSTRVQAAIQELKDELDVESSAIKGVSFNAGTGLTVSGSLASAPITYSLDVAHTNTLYARLDGSNQPFTASINVTGTGTFDDYVRVDGNGAMVKLHGNTSTATPYIEYHDSTERKGYVGYSGDGNSTNLAIVNEKTSGNIYMNMNGGYLTIGAATPPSLSRVNISSGSQPFAIHLKSSATGVYQGFEDNTGIVGYIGSSNNLGLSGGLRDEIALYSTGSTLRLATGAAARVTVTNSEVSFDGDIRVKTQKKLILDSATGHTYIWEGANDIIRFVSGGTQSLELKAGEANFPAIINAVGSGATPNYIKVENSGSTGWLGSYFLAQSNNSIRGAGIGMAHGTDGHWFAGTPYQNGTLNYMIGYVSGAWNQTTADISNALFTLSNSGLGSFDGGVTTTTFTSTTANGWMLKSSQGNHGIHYDGTNTNIQSQGVNTIVANGTNVTLRTTTINGGSVALTVSGGRIGVSGSSNASIYLQPNSTTGSSFVLFQNSTGTLRGYWGKSADSGLVHYYNYTFGADQQRMNDDGSVYFAKHIDVGSGSSDSQIRFWDSPNSGYKELKWDTTGQFELQDSTGAFYEIIHAGNIANFTSSESDTLQTVTGRGATSSNPIGITNTSNSTSSFYLGEQTNQRRIRYKNSAFQFVDSANSFESISAAGGTFSSELRANSFISSYNNNTQTLFSSYNTSVSNAQQFRIAHNNTGVDIQNLRGSINFLGNIQIASGEKIQWGDSSQYIEGSSVSDNLKLGTANTNRILIDSNGHVYFNPLTTNDTSLYFSSSNNNTINVATGSDTDGNDLWVNYRGYNNAFTRSRDFIVGDGKGAQVANFQGSNKAVSFYGALDITGNLTVNNIYSNSGSNLGLRTSGSGDQIQIRPEGTLVWAANLTSIVHSVNTTISGDLQVNGLINMTSTNEGISVQDTANTDGWIGMRTVSTGSPLIGVNSAHGMRISSYGTTTPYSGYLYDIFNINGTGSSIDLGRASATTVNVELKSTTRNQIEVPTNSSLEFRRGTIEMARFEAGNGNFVIGGTSANGFKFRVIGNTSLGGNTFVNGQIHAIGSDIFVEGATDSAGTFIRDINFTNSSETSGDKRQVILRANSDDGASGTRGGKLQIFTRIPSSGTFSSVLELEHDLVRANTAMTVSGLLNVDHGTIRVGQQAFGSTTIEFWDDDSDVYRSLQWSNPSDEWQVEDDSGSMRTLVHSGNIGSYTSAESDTLQAVTDRGAITTQNIRAARLSSTGGIIDFDAMTGSNFMQLTADVYNLYKGGVKLLSFDTSDNAAFTGNVTIGGGGVSNTRLVARGSTNDNTLHAFEAAKSSGASIFLVRNDGRSAFHGTMFVDESTATSNSSLFGVSGQTYGVRIGVSTGNGGMATIHGVDDTLLATYEQLEIRGSNLFLQGAVTRVTGILDIHSNPDVNLRINAWDALNWTGNELRFGGISSSQWNEVTLWASGGESASFGSTITLSKNTTVNGLTYFNNSSYWNSNNVITYNSSAFFMYAGASKSLYLGAGGLNDHATISTVGTFTVNGGWTDLYRNNVSNIARFRSTNVNGGYTGWYDGHNSNNAYRGYVGYGSTLWSGAGLAKFGIRSDEELYLSAYGNAVSAKITSGHHLLVTGSVYSGGNYFVFGASTAEGEYFQRSSDTVYLYTGGSQILQANTSSFKVNTDIEIASNDLIFSGANAFYITNNHSNSSIINFRVKNSGGSNTTSVSITESGIYAHQVSTGQGYTEVYNMNQNVRTTDSVTFANVSGNGSGLTNVTATNADTVDGYHASTSYGTNTVVVRDGTGYIYTSWHHLQNNTGLYMSQGNYFYAEANGWISRSGSSSLSQIRLQNTSATTLGFVYSTTSGDVGFLNSSAAWVIRGISSGMDLHANTSTYVNQNFYTNDDVRRGAVYANTNNDVGFLDADGEWAIRHTANSQTEFRINNTTYATLNTTGLNIVGQVNTGIGWTEVYLMNQNVRSSDSPSFIDLYIDDQIISTGDTNTYIQFHAADQWRVVTNGIERFEINNSGITATLAITAPNFIDSSDSRLKSETGEEVLGLELIKEFEAKRYFKSGIEETGFYADNLPSRAQYMARKMENGYWGMDYKNLHAIEIKAIQEIDSRVTLLERENEVLKKEIQALKRRAA